MPVKNYRAYARSAKGIAARASARARYIAKRKASQAQKPATVDAAPLAEIIANWRTPCHCQT